MKFPGMSRSHLFLIELIAVVLFFSFAGAITVQVFSKASQLADDATALNGAILAVQTAAEIDKAVPYENIAVKESIRYFDRDFQETDRSNAMYTVTADVDLEEREAGMMALWDYTAASENGVIYKLQAKKYYPVDKYKNSTGKVD